MIKRERAGHVYDLGRYTVTEQAMEAYADIAGGFTPVFGIVPVWSGIADINQDPELGLDESRVVHGEQRMRFLRPFRDGQILHSKATVESIAERGANEVVTLRVDSIEADAPVLSQWLVIISRGTAAPATGAGSNGTQPARPAARQEPPTPTGERSTFLGPDITYRYAEAAGDDNRIHTDPEFARRAGLPGIIVQGMCLLHVATRAVLEVEGREPAEVGSLSVRFASILTPDHELRTRVWADGGGASFEALGPDGQQILK
ncbi:MAG: MaoC family dehydratase N-terminal domain-containing protein, partial [Candidatus Dormibacteraeota bacterium]|nr:MaoC family dehydratase N-terminal domain-containing protein [Candidatus Dormibacteraeota bacterium]